MVAETITFSMSDLARLETLEQVAAAPTLSERDRAVQALERAGLIRPLTPDRLERYTRLAPDERASVRRDLAARRFSPPLSEQIIQDRGLDVAHIRVGRQRPPRRRKSGAAERR